MPPIYSWSPSSWGLPSVRRRSPLPESDLAAVSLSNPPKHFLARRHAAAPERSRRASAAYVVSRNAGRPRVQPQDLSAPLLRRVGRIC